jgi:hypothetical protein
MVDVDDETLGVRELDGKHLDPGQVVLDSGRDLTLQRPFLVVCRRHRLSQKKWARRAHFAESVKMVGRV